MSSSEAPKKIIIKRKISTNNVPKSPILTVPTKNVSRMTQSDYKGKDLRTHIYTTPDMYIGSDKPVTQRVFMHMEDTNRIDEYELEHIPAIVQTYMEVVSNTSDCINRSRRKGWTGRPNGEPYIIISVKDGWVSCRNYGLPIPVEIHEESGLYVPSFIFGTVFTSSNYNDETKGEERHEGGRNGVGAKVANIFSKNFEVTVNDSYNSKLFNQVWEDNMLKANEPTIQNSTDPESWVEISYFLDFERFNLPAGYDENYVSLFRVGAIGLSFTCKCPIMFNDVIFDNQHIVEYSWYYFGDIVTEALVHYELRDPETEEIKSKKCSLGFKVLTPVIKKDCENHVILPLVELLLIDPSFLDKKLIVSFTNSLLTIDNGVHVDGVYDAVIPSITERINEGRKANADGAVKKDRKTLLAAKMKAKKSKDKDKSKPKEPKKKITAANVKPHLSMVLSCRVVNPRFKSQDKAKLVSPNVKLTLNEKEINEILRWKLMDFLSATLRAIQMTALTKTDGRKIKHIRLEKGFDANLAGGPKSRECILFIVEGDSALAYATRYISALGPKARDVYGVIPIRGKLLNVKKADPEKIAANAEITLIKKILGLKENVDYTIEDNRNQLRYGKLSIMTDADSDGSHIKGLLINLFNELYPSLIVDGFICDYRTKYLRVMRGKAKPIDFYTPDEYEAWRKITPDWEKYKTNYYKGLGTSEKKDIIDDSKAPLFIDLSYDKRATDTINLAFGKINADDRKNWLEEWRNIKKRPFIIRKMTFMTLTTFFNREFMLYVLDSLERAIPRFADGLKRSQGQILWGVMKQWPSLEGEKRKVAQLAGSIAGFVDYKHNEMCLSEAIKSMARFFTGSNNLPLLQPKGQFGERMFGGADSASARYIYTKPSSITKYIFRTTDNTILSFHDDGGKHSDPIYFLPVIPFALINGINGVATAYSTNVMNYNPIEIIDWIDMWISNTVMGSDDELPELIPWYRGFTGEIYLIEAGTEMDNPNNDVDEEVTVNESVELNDDEDKKINDPDDPELESENASEIRDAREQIINEETSQDNKASKLKYNRVIIRGKFHKDHRGIVTVTELPIGRWPVNYYSFLEDLREMKEITDFDDNTTDDAIKYTIKGMKNPSLLKLNLVRKFRLSNMVFLDEDGIPKRYDTIKEYLYEFCEFRLRKYEERKNYEINKMSKEIQDLGFKIKFLRLIVNKQIRVINRKVSEIKANMRIHEIPEEIYDSTNLGHTSEDYIIKFENDLKNKQVLYENYMNKPVHEIWLDELQELKTALLKDKGNIRTIPGYYGMPGKHQFDEE